MFTRNVISLSLCQLHCNSEPNKEQALMVTQLSAPRVTVAHFTDQI